jgi:hypothetical protein
MVQLRELSISNGELPFVYMGSILPYNRRPKTIYVSTGLEKYESGVKHGGAESVRRSSVALVISVVVLPEIWEGEVRKKLELSTSGFQDSRP